MVAYCFNGRGGAKGDYTRSGRITQAQEEAITMRLVWGVVLLGSLTNDKQQQGEWVEFCSSITVHHCAATLQDWVQQTCGDDPVKLQELQDLETIGGRYTAIGFNTNGMPVYRQQLASGLGLILMHFDGKDV